MVSKLHDTFACLHPHHQNKREQFRVHKDRVNLKDHNPFTHLRQWIQVRFRFLLSPSSLELTWVNNMCLGFDLS